LAAFLSPPKRLFGFEHDVAPGQADIVQIAFGQCGQQPPLLLAFAPDMQRFADLREKTGTMMIYHRFMCENGHFRLLKLISCPQYRHYQDFHKRHFVPLHMT